jgi:dipeptidyl aminopeptidase/acylaminoacyl peptidase
MKYLLSLKECKMIESVKLVDFKSDLDSFDKQSKHYFQGLLEKMEVYQLSYTVAKKLKVVGFVAIPFSKTTLPCLIHLRGGSRDFGSLTTRSILFHLVKYAAEGYIVIASQYPGNAGGTGKDTFGGPDDLNSIKKLRQILKCIPCADIKKIGIQGHSRGGLMAYMLLREVSWVKAGVISGAPTDQVRQGRDRPKWRAHQIEMWGKSKKEMIKRSPLKWIEDLPKKTPLLIMHGLSDWRVSPIDSIEMSRALLKHSVPHRLILFEGADHGISEHKKEFIAQSLSWFKRFLKEEEALPSTKPHGD